MANPVLSKLTISWPVRLIGMASSYLGRIGARYETCEWLAMWEESGVDLSEFRPNGAGRYILTGKDADGASLIPSGMLKKAERQDGN